MFFAALLVSAAETPQPPKQVWIDPVVMELLHPMGFIDKELILGPHDGALIAAK